MRALITGAGGFVGGHLLTFLSQQTAFDLHGTLLSGVGPAALQTPSIAWHTLDLCNLEAVRDLIETVRPDRIYHLAGQAYVPRSFEDPWDTIQTNVRGALNLLDTVQAAKLADTRILVIGSAEMYGIVRPDDLPLTESHPFNPASPYSVSKITQDLLALQYYTTHRLFTVRVRAFNHIGPGQNDRFAIAAFASQIARIERGWSEPVVQVGDLSAERDFTDVRDIVRAYYMTLEQGEAGAAYNVCSGVMWKLRDILDRLLQLSDRPIAVQVDPTRLRPIEIPQLLGDYSALHMRTGWQPQIPIEQTLRDVLNDWRERITALPADKSPSGD